MKIAVLSSHTASLFWFRMDLMKDMVAQGCEVVAVGSEPEDVWKARFAEEGIAYKSIFVERNGINPLSDLKTLKDIYQLIKTEKPDKVFMYQAKTVVYGSIAAKLNGIKEIYALIAGLGSIFRGTGLKNRIIRIIMNLEYKLACRISRRVFFQNKDDLSDFLSNKLVDKNKTVIINGSGVNLDKFKPAQMPDADVFLYIGRLIKDKGVMEYLKAASIIKKKYPQSKFLLVGPYDTNPSALKPEDIQRFIDDGIVEYFGEQTDVRPFIAECGVYILPSYHEGTPKTVLEAMAMGRAIITSDAPGCRETVTNGVNGLLAEVRNVQEIADKIEYLICNPDVRNKMGNESLRIATEKYDVRAVNRKIMNIMEISNVSGV